MPNKTYIIDVPREESINLDFKVMKSFNEKVHTILCIHDLRITELCAAAGLEWYWAYPITSFYELQGILALGPAYLYITAPLTMDLNSIKKLTNIPLRMTPNVAYDSYIPRGNGICGQWGSCAEEYQSAF